MCHGAMNWVLKDIAPREDLKPAEKWFMMIIADHADVHYWSFIHGHGTLAKDAGMSKRTVFTILAKFEELKLIRRSSRFRADGTKSTDLISILGVANPALGLIQDAKTDADHVQIATPEGARIATHKEGTKPGKLTREAKASVDRVDEVRSAFDAYNALADRLGSGWARALNSDRRRRLKARLQDCGGLDGWKSALEKVEASPFLMGQTSHHFSLNLDFILQPSSFTKLIEGQYEDKHDGRGSPATRYPTASDRDQQRANARIQAMVDGLGQASAPRRRLWDV